MKRRDLLLTAAAGSVAGLPLPGLAQDFPKAGSTIKYVVPFPPGGLTDVMARIVGQKLGEAWKVPVVVENKAGGNAQIGAEAVAKGPSDGSQILAITLTQPM
jgi:tripartite-type tricarboxylate transporter receptor subunit TctC